jgi:hypothetical protein
VQLKALRLMTGSQRADRILGYRGRSGHIGQHAAIGSPELEHVVRPARHPVSLFVDRAMMTATQQDEVSQRGRPPVRPVPHVMPFRDPHPAPRESTILVSMVQGAPQRGRDRSRARADLQYPPLLIVPHEHAARVAREAPRRFL